MGKDERLVVVVNEKSLLIFFQKAFAEREGFESKLTPLATI